MEEIKKILSLAKNNELYEFKEITTTEFKTIHPALSEYSVTRIGKALRELENTGLIEPSKRTVNKRTRLLPVIKEYK